MQEILQNLKNKYPEYWEHTTDTTQVRKRTLQFLLIAYCGMGGVLSILHLLEHRTFLVWKVLFFASLSFLGVQMLRRGVAVQKVGHYALICLSVILLLTTLLYKQGYYLVTFQFTFIILSSGFYILGAKWGLFYSLLNILSVGLVTVATNYFHIHVITQVFPEDVPAIAFTLLCNYAMLLYVHFYFLKESELANAKEKTLLEELRISASQARDLAEYKTNFLITMSHEIRTPLHAIIGGLDLLASEKSASDQEKNLESVRLFADVLNSIIDDILSLNDLESNQIELRNEAFQPLAIVVGVYNTLKGAADEKGLKLSLDTSEEPGSLFVVGDPMRLAQIIINLVTNAIKYTEKGSVEIIMKTRPISDEHAELFFRVSDTGIGIPPEVYPYIFQPFKMTHSNTKKQYHGTGLGLTLIHRLVHLFGGKLDFTSREGEGTSFFFNVSFPVSQAKKQVPEPASNKVLTPLPINVLVAEDNKMNAMIVKHFLERWEVDFDIVENGLAALESVKSKNYQVVLMDINMPLMDGIEASLKIRALEDPKKANIPIIALTAASKDSFESSGIHTVFNDWIAKPFHAQILHEKLSELI